MQLDEMSQIPYLSKGDIAMRVVELLESCWDGLFPVDIEVACDYCGIAIVPISRFKK